MATVTRPSDALPDPGDALKAEPIRDHINNILTFLESNNIDSANVDYSSSDGIMVLNQSQTVTGAKNFSSTIALSGSAVVDLNGIADSLVLDADADTTISAPTDDQIDIEVGGSDLYKFTATAFVSGSNIVSDTTNTDSLGTTALTWSDLYLGDASVLAFGEDQDVTLTHDPDDGIFLNAGMKLGFRDMGGEYIYSVSDGTLGIAAATEVDITTTTLDVNGAVDISGATAIGGTLNVGASTAIANVKDEDNMSSDSATSLATQQSIKAYVDSQVAGADTLAELTDTNITSAADASMLLYDTGTSRWIDNVMSGDATMADTGAVTLAGTNTNLTTLANVTTVGTIGTGTWQGTKVASAYLDDQTAHLNGSQSFTGAKTFGAASQFNSTVTVGADDAGYDVIFYGNTASANATWDTSADDLILSGAAGLIVPDGQLTLGSTALTSTAAELNVLDGVTAGTVAASKAVVVDSNKDAASFRNLTLTGELDAVTLDISGNADIDGTTNLDAVDIDGATQIDGTVTVGVDDTGYDVKFFGASAGAYMEWDESADQLRIVGASADATTSTGKLLLATSLNDINANDVIGKIEFQAPLETGADAISVSASIKAIAQSTFTSSSNATDIVFSTGHSETATEKLRITSQGEIGIGGANYGSDGQVLTSGGAGAAPAWENAASSGHTIQEEGSGLTARANLNFVGAGVTATDDSGNNATKVTVTPTGASLPFTNSNGGSDAIALTSAALGESLVSDTSPQLGGNLDVNGQSIVSDGSNENIPITPHGTGSVVISKADINGGAIDGTAIGAASASTGAFTTLAASGNADFNGDLDVDGTLETDALTIGGTALLANDTNNRVTTATGSGTLNGEANLTFDGSTLAVTGALTTTGDYSSTSSETGFKYLTLKNTNTTAGADRGSALVLGGAINADNYSQGMIEFHYLDTIVATIVGMSSGSTSGTGRGGAFRFFTKSDNGSNTERLRIHSDGHIQTGYAASAPVTMNDDDNAKNTFGLTLMQDATDDEILAFKSSDVAHGMTNNPVETDTFAHFRKAHADYGGLQLASHGEGQASANLRLEAACGADTSDTTTSYAAVQLYGYVKNGAVRDGMGTTSNAVGFNNAGTTRVIIKGDGTVHASDTSWATALDDMPDALAGRAYTTEMAHRQGNGLMGGMEIDAPDLVQRMEDAGIVTHAEKEGEGVIPGHRFLNVQKGIKFSWDMGFQNFSFLAEIAKVLSPEQREALPAQMQQAFAQLENNKTELN
jgi:hypothetical protein